MRAGHIESPGSIGDRIRSQRLARGWNQRELGELCGFKQHPQPRIAGYENGKRTPDYSDVRMLARILGCTEIFLLYGDSASPVSVVQTLPLIPWGSLGMKKKRGAVKKVPIIWPGQPISPEAYFIPIMDDALAPDFVQGQLLLIDPTIDPKGGQVVVASVNGDKPSLYELLPHLGGKKSSAAGRRHFKSLSQPASMLREDNDTIHIYRHVNLGTHSPLNFPPISSRLGLHSLKPI